MEYINWLPPEIRNEDEFLCEELKELQQKALKERNIDISMPLYFFENRVLFSKNGAKAFKKCMESRQYCEVDFYGHNNDPISWETIRTFEETNGTVTYEIDKRKAQFCFLIGWIEFFIWMRGNFNDQITYDIPELYGVDDNLSIYSDQFIMGETLAYSIDAARKFWDKYFCLTPEKRQKKPRFFDPRLSKEPGSSWKVFVPSDLSRYYIEDNDKSCKAEEYKLPPLQKSMRTINCPKKTNARHAAAANYESWQVYLHAIALKKGRRMVKKDEYIEEFKKNRPMKEKDEEYVETLNEDRHIPKNIKEILNRIANKTEFKHLPEKDKEIISKASKISSEIWRQKRIAEITYLKREIIVPYFRKNANHLDFIHLKEQVDSMDDLDEPVIVSHLKNVITWISEMWMPQWAGEEVTASDIAEQRHIFDTDNDGRIELKCYWEGETDYNPAYIKISWKADVSETDGMGIRFINPETQKILTEELLGNDKVGEEIFTGKDLGFDPGQDKFAISIFFYRS